MAEAAISMMLECPICQEQFSEPRVLPCQHTFCLHCLEKIREHQSTTESIPCPVCRATYHLSTAGIDALPKNIFAANLIDIVRQDDVQEQAGSGASNTENRQLCTLDTDECSQPATVYCDVCDVYMCEQCELYHKNNKLAKKHKTISVTQVTTRKIKPFCPKHTSIPLDIFCRDCNLIICSSCLTNHEEHKCCGLNSVVDNFSGQLDHVLAQTDESLKAIYKAIKVTQEQAVKVKADVTNLKQQTSAAYRAIQRHVEEQEQRHLASIDEYYQQAEKVIAETLDKQETLEAVLHSIQLYGQHLSKASAYDLTINLRSLVKRSKEEVSKSVPELRWKVDLTWSDWKVKGEVDRVALMREDEVNVETDQQLTTVTGQSATHGDHGVRQLTTVTGQSATHGDHGVRQLTTVTGQSATHGDHGVRQLTTVTGQSATHGDHGVRQLTTVTGQSATHGDHGVRQLTTVTGQSATHGDHGVRQLTTVTGQSATHGDHGVRQLTTVTGQSATHGDHGVRQLTTVTGQSATHGDHGVRQLTTVTGQSATHGDHGVRQLTTVTGQSATHGDHGVRQLTTVTGQSATHGDHGVRQLTTVTGQSATHGDHGVRQLTTVTGQSATHGDHGVRQQTTVTGQSVTCGDRVVRQLTTVTGQSATRGDRGVGQLNTFTTQCNIEVGGMVSYHSHLFIVHYNLDKLDVYDEGGSLKRSVQIPGKWCDSQDMCLVQGEGGTHSMVISDYDGQCLWWLTTEKQAGDVKLGHPQQHKLQYNPSGVSTDRSGRAVVADYDNRRVYVYSHPGQHVTCLQLSGDVYPHQALTDQSDGYVVRHRWSVDQLLWVNSAGQVTRRYTDQPAVCAHHIVDDGTCLLVSDPLNHCVHIVTREGRHDGHLITDIDPTSVCLDPAGRRLWVAYNGKDNKRHVMEMSYTPQSSRVTSSVTSCDTSPITSPVTSTPIVSLTLKVTLPKIT